MARKQTKTPALPLAASMAPALQPGEMVGSYRIIRQIGAGGMGAVYEAEHLHLNTRAAIKVLLPELSANPDAIKRFVNEARAASDLKHPRIVAVHECAQRPNGQWFIALEFVEGGSLKRKMHSLGGALGINDVVSIVAQVASALRAAHENKKGPGRIIHRDIKPENILLSQSPTNPNDDDVTVVDFGICKIDESRGGAGTQQGVALGTPNYMAPEYLRGDAIDHRVDVYALGVVAWEMLTGQSLWGEGDQPPTRIHERQRTGARPINPCAVRDHIPPELGAAVASALAFNPAERWPTVRAFALAVAHAVTSEWGETGMATLHRVARDLEIAPSDEATAGRPMPPPLAPTLEVAIPVTPSRFPPGAVPIVASVDAVPTQPHLPGHHPTHLPAHLATPAPAASAPSRADALTVRASGTPTNAVGGSQVTATNPDPIRAARHHEGPQPRRRRALFVVLGAAGAAVVGVALVMASATNNGRAKPTATPDPAGETSAATVTAPPDAAISTDAMAPAVGATVDAGTDAAPAAVDAGARRKRPRSTNKTGDGVIDPDGLVQP